MERVTEWRFTKAEQDKLNVIRLAADVMREAHVERDAAIREGIALGLSVRVVGKAAGLSAAQVSRLTSSGSLRL